MSNTMARAEQLATALSAHKRMATGRAVAAFPVRALRQHVGTFDDFASELYKWFWESLREDRTYLLGTSTRDERAVIERFQQVLNDQRHVAAHSGYEYAARARQWRTAQEARSPGDGASVLEDALIGHLCEALARLSSIAQRISQNQSSAGTWREQSATSADDLIRDVFDSLGKQPSPGVLAYAVRQFQAHPRLIKARTYTARRQLGAAVVMGKYLAPLSVPIDELLDEFGLIGDIKAESLILVAHGIEASGRRGEYLLRKVRQVWPVVES